MLYELYCERVYYGSYQFNELKSFFEPPKELEEHKKWSEVENETDLREYIKYSYDGMACPYHFEKIVK